MQDPKVEIWEGAALAKAPSVGAQPAGFVRAAVLRWRDVPAAVPPRSRPSPLRIAELWTGPGVVVAGAAGALTVSTALTDGARVVTTNLAVADATIPPEALLAVVDGDVVATHAERVASLCAERATSAQAPASWRDAPLVVELGAQTALAVHETLERLNAVRSVGVLEATVLAQGPVCGGRDRRGGARAVAFLEGGGGQRWVPGRGYPPVWGLRRWGRYGVFPGVRRVGVDGGRRDRGARLGPQEQDPGAAPRFALPPVSGRRGGGLASVTLFRGMEGASRDRTCTASRMVYARPTEC